MAASAKESGHSEVGGAASDASQSSEKAQQPWVAMVVAFISVAGTIASAAFAAWSGVTSAQAKAQVDLYSVRFNHAAAFSATLQKDLPQLLVDANSGRRNIDIAATQIFSLFAIAETYQERHSLVYVALSNHNKTMNDMVSDYLGNSQSKDDQQLATEFLHATVAYTPDNANGATDPPPPSQHADVTPFAISNVTPKDAAGWVYLGESAFNAAPTDLASSNIVKHRIEGTGQVVKFLGYVHLRDVEPVPKVGALPRIVGVIAPSQTARVQEPLVFLPLPNRSGLYAVWASIQRCNCPCC